MKKKRKTKIQQAYDRAAKGYAGELYDELQSKPMDVKFLDLFVERVDPGHPVAEIGCGPGEISVYLKTKGLDMIGLDISEQMIGEAKKLNPRMAFQVGDVFSLDFPDHSFSGVAAPFLIVNFTIDEIPEAFREIHRVLLPGGLFYFSFHSGDEIVHEENLFAENNPLDFYFHPVDNIQSVLEGCGFELMEWVIRSPYKDAEYPSTRAYFFARKRK